MVTGYVLLPLDGLVFGLGLEGFALLVNGFEVFEVVSAVGGDLPDPGDAVFVGVVDGAPHGDLPIKIITE